MIDNFKARQEEKKWCEEERIRVAKKIKGMEASIAELLKFYNQSSDTYVKGLIGDSIDTLRCDIDDEADALEYNLKSYGEST